MSKIGRKPIKIDGLKIDLKGNEIHYSGSKSSGVHVLPKELEIVNNGTTIQIVAKEKSRDVNRVWGLHRALLHNKLHGAAQLFEKKVIIEGLGFKVAQSGSILQFTLGYSHKKQITLPKGVELVEVDKTGQKMTFKSADKELLGLTCSQLRLLRPVEPYKGTGIRVEGDRIFRKAGKTKSA